jgi:hypothetical protein
MEIWINNYMTISELLNESIHDRYAFRAIFIVGAPGSGKNYIQSKLNLEAAGFKTLNIDYVKYYLQQHDYDAAGKATNAQLRMYLSQNLGLIFNMTGRDDTKILNTNTILENNHYETAMVFVDADIETSLKRIENREMHSDIPEDRRKVDLGYFKSTFDEVHNKINVYKTIFGNNFFYINNGELTQETFHKLEQQINRFLKRRN